MRVISVIAAAVLLSGCAGTTTGGQETTPPTPTSATTAPETQDPSPDSSPSQDEADTAQPCEEVMFQGAQGTVRSQQSALAQQDFEAARAFASNSFRSGVSVEQFQDIIEGRYSFLLNDPGLDFVDCQRRGDKALIRVEVSGSPVIIMIYGMVVENDSWFIDAASVAGSREEVTT